jgi:ferredoxin--NADP+ reductase
MQFHYGPDRARTVPHHASRRIGALIEGRLFGHPVRGDQKLNPETDRAMLCG